MNGTTGRLITATNQLTEGVGVVPSLRAREIREVASDLIDSRAARKNQKALLVAEMVIEILVSSEAELRGRVAELESETKWLRDTVRVAIHMLHTANVQLDRSRSCLVRSRNDVRALRADQRLKAEER